MARLNTIYKVMRQRGWQRTREEFSNVLESTKELAYDDCPTFIETAKCSQEILQEVCMHYLKQVLLSTLHRGTAQVPP